MEIALKPGGKKRVKEGKGGISSLFVFPLEAALFTIIIIKLGKAILPLQKSAFLRGDFLGA